MYENKARKFNIKILKMSYLYENRMKIKRKDCRIAILLFIGIIGINFVKRGLPRLLRWSEEVVRLHMEEEQDWRFS
mgnify:CR=1 FL=1